MPRRYEETIYTECEKNILVFPYLEKFILDVEFIRGSWEADKQMMIRAASAKTDAERTFIWICRNSNCVCAHEQDVFLAHTQSNRLCRHPEQKTKLETVHAFIVEVTDVIGPYVFGNVYKLNRDAYAAEVRQRTQPQLVGRSPDLPRYPRVCHAIPADPDRLNLILSYHRERRKQALKAV